MRAELSFTLDDPLRRAPVRRDYPGETEESLISRRVRREVALALCPAPPPSDEGSDSEGTLEPADDDLQAGPEQDEPEDRTAPSQMRQDRE